MKNSIVLLIVFFCTSNVIIGRQSDTLLIKPGKGVDNIVVHRSSQEAVKKFKKVTFITSKGTGIACGTFGSRRFRSAKYKNDSLGLMFEFKTSLVRAPFQIFHKLKLQEIIVSKKGLTDNGLVIGKSTKQDVIALYGLPPNWKNEGFIAYYEKGISLSFDDNGIISEIQIFSPYMEQTVF